VHGRIFATQPTADMLRVMLDEAGIRTAVEPHTECCSEFSWGNELACVEVTLGRVTRGLVLELLTDAWEQESGR
jgi:hypothetical protein